MLVSMSQRTSILPPTSSRASPHEKSVTTIPGILPDTFTAITMRPVPQVSAKMDNKTAGLTGGVCEKTAEEKNAEAQQLAIAPRAVHSADIEYAIGTLDTNEYYD